MFGIENDGLALAAYASSSPPRSKETIALARLALSRTVTAAIGASLKSGDDNWKRTFIQYKSRCEKRRSWRQRTQQLGEIESKLIAAAGDDDDNMDSKNDDDDNSQESKPASDAAEKKAQGTKAQQGETKDEAAAAATPRAAKLTRQQLAELEDEEAAEERARQLRRRKKATAATRDVKFSDDESDATEEECESEADDDEMNGDDVDSDEDESDQQDDDGDEEEEDEEEEEEENEEEGEGEGEDATVSLAKYSASAAKQLPPLQIDTRNKPSRMVIRQIDMSALGNDVDELPIEASKVDKKDADDDDDDDELPLHKSDRSAPAASTHDDGSGYGYKEATNNNNNKTLKVADDPFFLDAQGNEIENERVEAEMRDRRRHASYRSRYADGGGGGGGGEADDANFSYSSYDMYKNKRRMLSDSSFRSSLSSASGEGARGGYRGRGGAASGGDRFSHSDTRPRRGTDYSNAATYNNKPVDKVDVASLHPSWQAKKQMEDKLKTLKFEGKKVTFNDD